MSFKLLSNGNLRRSTCRSFCRVAVAKFCCLEVVIIISYLGSACTAQKGFVSVDCGAPARNYTNADTTIDWVSDASFASGWQSEARAVQAPAGSKEAQSLSSVRYFPGEQSKYCYVFSQAEYPFIQQGTAFLVRASFWAGSLTFPDASTTATFQLLINADIWDNVSITLPQSDVVLKEAYMLPSNLTTSTPSISVCLAGRGMGMSIPFISSLELRLLSLDFYTWYTTKYRLPLHIINTVNYGAASNDVIRYPLDPMDHIWQPDTSHQPTQNTTRALDWVTDRPPPPQDVMQTAYVQNAEIILTFEVAKGAYDYFVAEYIYDTRVLISKGQRVFIWQRTGYDPRDPLDLFNFAQNYVVLYSGREAPLRADDNGQLIFTLTKAPNSTYGPLISALLLFRDFGSISPGSNSQDVDAITFIQTNHFTSLRSSSGDPCLPYPYNWLNCTNDQIPRVSNLLLSNKNLEETIPPKIGSLQSLVGIFLDHNKLSGSIPDLGNLYKLQILDLSNNNFNGAIPAFLAKLPSLRTLRLDNNKFSGEVPQEILEKLSDPNFKFSISGNPLLCTSSNCTTNQNSKKSNIGLMAILVSISIATTLIIVIILVVILYCKRKSGRYKRNLLSRIGKTKECICFTYSEVRSITNNFKKQLGVGGFGPVYYGELPADQRPIAVKVLSAASHQGEREFLNEVNLLSRIHHKNLVTLLGYCVEEKLVLIYEYMSNGSLIQALQGKCSILHTWEDHLRVAVDAAEGLEYLHNGCNPYIIHRDVKSSNILLGQEMRGKLSDFGISRSKVSTTDGVDGVEMFTDVQGSFGYLDPEYAERQVVTHKVDVYAFGIVLLEICTGRAVLSQQSHRQPQQSGRQPQHLAQWARFHVERGNIHEVLNSGFNGCYNVSAAWKVVDVAMRCVEFESRKRPDMSEVCLELKSALSIELQGEVTNNTTFTMIANVIPR